MGPVSGWAAPRGRCQAPGVDRCDGCGFSYAEVGAAAVPATLRELAAEHAALLRGGTPRATLGTRPAAEVWSVLEYACHVRDVLLVQRDRLVLALVEDRPAFARMYRDERVGIERYGEEDPGEVAATLVTAADLLARCYERRSPAELARPIVYSGVLDRDVDWLGRHTVHEASHHLGDVRGCSGASPGRRRRAAPHTDAASASSSSDARSAR